MRASYAPPQQAASPYGHWAVSPTVTRVPGAVVRGEQSARAARRARAASVVGVRCGETAMRTIVATDGTPAALSTKSM